MSRGVFPPFPPLAHLCLTYYIPSLLDPLSSLFLRSITTAKARRFSHSVEEQPIKFFQTTTGRAGDDGKSFCPLSTPGPAHEAKRPKKGFLLPPIHSLGVPTLSDSGLPAAATNSPKGGGIETSPVHTKAGDGGGMFLQLLLLLSGTDRQSQLI